MTCYHIIIMTRYSQSVWPRRWTNLISNVNCSGHEDTITSPSRNLQHNSLPNHIVGIQCASKYDRPCVIIIIICFLFYPDINEKNFNGSQFANSTEINQESSPPSMIGCEQY